MDLMVECNICEAKFMLTAVSVLEMQTEIEGQSIWIKYYECPVCKKRYYGQVDNSVSKKMLAKLVVGIGKMSNAKETHNILTKKQSAKITKLRNNLETYRFNLKKKYDGISVNGEVVNFDLGGVMLLK